MGDNSQTESVEKKKKADTIKYLYFSRYLMIRYSVVLFLFVNLFWLLILCQYQKWFGIIVAAGMTLLAAIAAIEQLTKMHNRQLDVPLTRHYFWAQMIVNTILIFCAFLPIKKQLFPFITTKATLSLIILLLLAGLILAYFCEKRIHNINSGKDKYTKVIKTAEKSR